MTRWRVPKEGPPPTDLSVMQPLQPLAATPPGEEPPVALVEAPEPEPVVTRRRGRRRPRSNHPQGNRPRVRIPELAEQDYRPQSRAYPGWRR